MPDDGPRHFELENIFGKIRLRAKQPAQLSVIAPAAGSGRPTRRRPLGSISRDSLLWAAHELVAAQRHGRLQHANPGLLLSSPVRLSAFPQNVIKRNRGGRHRPLVSTGPSLHLNPVIEGGKGKGGFSVAHFDVSAPPERWPREIPPKDTPRSISALELTSPGPLRPDADDAPPRSNPETPMERAERT